jgi:hypothetical protein
VAGVGKCSTRRGSTGALIAYSFSPSLCLLATAGIRNPAVLGPVEHVRRKLHLLSSFCVAVMITLATGSLLAVPSFVRRGSLLERSIVNH